MGSSYRGSVEARIACAAVATTASFLAAKNMAVKAENE
jgi:hypothetical protein